MFRKLYPYSYAVITFHITAGIINSFVFTMNSYWWFFHTMTIFWKVWFPIHARNFKVNGHIKYLHLIIIGLALTFPIIPVGAALGTGGYVISAYPPSLNYCFPRSSDTFFYTFILPFCIIFSIGTTFNLLTLWKVLRIRKQLSSEVCI